jgi:hypothetical protein
VKFGQADDACGVRAFLGDHQLRILHAPHVRRLADLGKNIEKSGDRDGVVTAIVGALSSAAAREPQALSRCVEALGLALGALMQSAGEDATGTDDDRRALPDERTGCRAPGVR